MASTSTTDTTSDLTEHDRRFLEAAITCLKSPPELDTQKLAAKMGVKPKTITNKWGELRKKLFPKDGISDEPSGPPATPAKGKRKADGAGQDGGSARKTPRSAKGKGRGKAATQPENAEESVVDLDDSAGEV